MVDFLKTVVAFAPVSYVTAKAARPSRELFRIDRAMVDGSHGIGLCDRRVCASKSEESARYRSESARDVCSFLVLRVFACSVYLMPIVVGTATASVDGVHKGYVGWGKNGRWFFGAVLGFLTCVGSIGVFRDVALYKKVLGGRAKRVFDYVRVGEQTDNDELGESRAPADNDFYVVGSFEEAV